MGAMELEEKTVQIRNDFDPDKILASGQCFRPRKQAAGFLGLRPLLQLLDTPAEILEEAYSYIIVIDLGVIVMFLYNLCAGLLRAIGNSVMPLVFLLLMLEEGEIKELLSSLRDEIEKVEGREVA